MKSFEDTPSLSKPKPSGRTPEQIKGDHMAYDLGSLEMIAPQGTARGPYMSSHTFGSFDDDEDGRYAHRDIQAFHLGDRRLGKDNLSGIDTYTMREASQLSAEDAKLWPAQLEKGIASKELLREDDIDLLRQRLLARGAILHSEPKPRPISKK